MYTSHGYHIPFTPLSDTEPFPVIKENCGGVRICPECTIEASPFVPALVEVAKPNYTRRIADMDFLERAKELVYKFAKEHLDKTDDVTFQQSDVYIVWFSKTLQNWKALVSTTLPDGMYYELTYNGDKRETYLDAYKKFKNEVVPD